MVRGCGCGAVDGAVGGGGVSELELNRAELVN